MEYTDAELMVEGLCGIPPPSDCAPGGMGSRPFDVSASGDNCGDPFDGRHRFGFDSFGTAADGAEKFATCLLSIKDGDGTSSLISFIFLSSPPANLIFFSVGWLKSGWRGCILCLDAAAL